LALFGLGAPTKHVEGGSYRGPARQGQATRGHGLHVVLRCCRRPATAAARERALERVLEGLPEVPVEVGVDQRVQRRVEVPDPEEDSHDDVRAVAGIAA